MPQQLQTKNVFEEHVPFSTVEGRAEDMGCGKTRWNWCYIGDMSKKVVGLTCKTSGCVCISNMDYNKTASFTSI